jgi:hypothetical protein
MPVRARLSHSTHPQPGDRADGRERAHGHGDASGGLLPPPTRSCARGAPSEALRRSASRPSRPPPTQRGAVAEWRCVWTEASFRTNGKRSCVASAEAIAALEPERPPRAFQHICQRHLPGTPVRDTCQGHLPESPAEKLERVMRFELTTLTLAKLSGNPTQDLESAMFAQVSRFWPSCKPWTSVDVSGCESTPVARSACTCIHRSTAHHVRFTTSRSGTSPHAAKFVRR